MLVTFDKCNVRIYICAVKIQSLKMGEVATACALRRDLVILKLFWGDGM
jgi:hypothetical protein